MESETKTAFAARLRLSRPRISQLIKQGLPVNANGTIPITEALRWFRANVSPSRGPAFAEPGSADLTEEKALLTKAQRERAELELEVRRGQLLDREEAKRGVAAFARVFRDGVLNFPARKGPDLAHRLGVEPRQLIPLLEAELRELLVELGKQPMPLEVQRD